MCGKNSTVHGNRTILPPHKVIIMNKIGLILLLVFILGVVVFSTWQLFAGNLAASFATLPLLLITYLFVIRVRRDPP